jgi:hypothetical protein
MKKFALAALMALPVLGMTTQNASAGNYCCGNEPLAVVKKYFVPESAVVYERDSRDAETRIRLKGGTWVYAKCRPYGWCELEPKLFDRAWVMEDCLVADYYERQSWQERQSWHERPFWQERREPVERPVWHERPMERPFWQERRERLDPHPYRTFQRHNNELD